MLTFLLSSYFFSLGLWAAKGWDLYTRHQNLKLQISILNDMSSRQKEALDGLMKVLSENPEYAAVNKHLLAVKQLTPVYTLENALMKIEENQKLTVFTENMVLILQQIVHGGPEGVVLTDYQSLTFQIKNQQKVVQEALVIY